MVLFWSLLISLTIRASKLTLKAEWRVRAEPLGTCAHGVLHVACIQLPLSEQEEVIRLCSPPGRVYNVNLRGGGVHLKKACEGWRHLQTNKKPPWVTCWTQQLQDPVWSILYTLLEAEKLRSLQGLTSDLFPLVLLCCDVFTCSW